MNNLRHMSVFAHIVEQGSITAAAEHLQLSKSVVSQHLKGLEAELGVALLIRTTRKQSLTVAGKSFYKHCRDINNLVNTACQQVRDTLEEPQGRVRITAPDALMGTLIVPAIARVIKQYPKLIIELISTDKQLSIVSDDIDLAIRVGESEISSLKQRRIGEFRDLLCAESEVVTRGVDENTLYIANTWQGMVFQHLLSDKKTGQTLEFVPGRLCHVDSFNTAIALITEGAGIGLIPEFLVGQIQPTVREVFPEYQLPPTPVYALHPYSQLMPLSVFECLAAIEEQFQTVMQK
ncbi:LysR family transcriptional regulator [uncultured Neptuniibacter sp.]|uniref:LysR family transcriptional regulator n=1 Tax=uncultured Neptuniibacter sp. TaxID=502143 RepID=UPI00262BFF2A|nr:LysR family transcriptional regulator [uncultured Neptuniibacter sp.]